MNKFVKGIALMIMVIFAALQTPPVIWASTIILAIVVGGGYFVKNYLLPSNSIAGQFNWRDVLSTLILAVLAAVGDSIGAIVVGGVISWALLGKTILYVVGTYFTTTFLMKNDPPITPPPTGGPK